MLCPHLAFPRVTLVCVSLKGSHSTVNGEKAKLEAEIEKLRAANVTLEQQLSEARENERLLVEYPDLHYNANNVGLIG